jgi:hypothetical protein
MSNFAFYLPLLIINSITDSDSKKVRMIVDVSNNGIFLSIPQVFISIAYSLHKLFTHCHNNNCLISAIFFKMESFEIRNRYIEIKKLPIKVLSLYETHCIVANIPVYNTNENLML